MKKIRRLHRVDPERLTTHQLLAEHERVFGPLSKQAKQRMMGGREMAPPPPQTFRAPRRSRGARLDRAAA